ncbi:unnamed protein product, partial [Symbiodinium microadriaticum]
MASAEGLADAWASSTSVLRALNAHGRIIVPDNAGSLKVDNKNAARNRPALTPVLEIMALQPNWELVKLPDLGKAFPGWSFPFRLMQLTKLRKDVKSAAEAETIKLDSIWIKSLSSHVKMKTRKQLASPDPDFFALQRILDPELPPARRAGDGDDHDDDDVVMLELDEPAPEDSGSEPDAAEVVEPADEGTLEASAVVSAEGEAEPVSPRVKQHEWSSTVHSSVDAKIAALKQQIAHAKEMAARAEIETQLVEIEDTQMGSAPGSRAGCPSTPEATPPREPSRPMKPLKSLSRHDMDPDLQVPPFPTLPPKTPPKTAEQDAESPADDASVCYDNDGGKLKPASLSGESGERADKGKPVKPVSLADKFELADESEPKPSAAPKVLTRRQQFACATQKKPRNPVPTEHDEPSEPEDSEIRVLKKPASKLKPSATAKCGSKGGKNNGKSTEECKESEHPAADSTDDKKPTKPKGKPGPKASKDPSKNCNKSPKAKASPKAKTSPKAKASPKAKTSPKAKASPSKAASEPEARDNVEPLPSKRKSTTGTASEEEPRRKMGRREPALEQIHAVLKANPEKARLVQEIRTAIQSKPEPTQETRAECIPNMEQWQFSVYWPPRASVGVLRRGASGRFVYLTAFNSGVYKNVAGPLHCAKLFVRLDPACWWPCAAEGSAVVTWGAQHREQEAMKRKAWFLKRLPFQQDLRFIEYFAGEGR